LIKYSTSEF